VEAEVEEEEEMLGGELLLLAEEAEANGFRICKSSDV
jgi:hypothetical protein